MKNLTWSSNHQGMKKISLLLISGLFLSLTSFIAEEWVAYTSEAGKFSILLPEKPKESAETVTEGTGSPYTTHLFISRNKKDVYLVGYVDYNPDFNFGNKSELEANRDNFLPGVDATLLESKFLKIEDHDAIEFTAKGNHNNTLWTAKVLIVGKRPYMLVIGSPDGKPSTDQEKFFSSFKLLK